MTGSYPDSWCRASVGQILSVKYGKGLTAKQRRDGIVPVYSSAGHVGWHDEQLARGPLLVIGRKGAAGKVTLSRSDAWVIDTAFYAEVPEGLNAAFLAYQLEAAGMRALDQSTAVPSLTRASLERVSLRIPPRLEQDRIVQRLETLLTSLEAAETQAQSVLRAIGAYETAICQQAIDEHRWPTARLVDVLVELRNGFFVSRPAASPPGTRIFRISAVRPMKLDIEDVRYADIPDPPDRFFVEAGDLLFTRYSGNPEYVGACAVVPTLRAPTLYPDKLIRAVVDRRVVDPEFLELACSHGHALSVIRSSRKTTAGQVGIAGGQLKDVPIPLPPLDAQQAIVRQVAKAREVTRRLSATLHDAMDGSAALRRALLRDAFDGSLVAQVSTDEPASTLLAELGAAKAMNKKRKRPMPATEM
jgi:restriction endonuclease S subunit